ncbi:heavy-metal-associated domain-containing protein [Porticoccus sp.]
MIKIIRMLFLSASLVYVGAWAQDPVYQVGVDGLACPFCAYGIEKQLQKLDGVKSVETDIAKGRVVVTMDDGKVLDRPLVEQAVKNAGFTLRSFEQIEEPAQ